MIQYGIDLNQRVKVHANEYHREIEEITEETLNKQANILNPDDVDITDLDKLSTANGERGWI